MGNLLLVIIAYIIVAVLTPFGIAWAIIFHLFKMPIYLKKFAIGIDQIGNVTCQYMLNFFLIKKDSKFKFGNEDQTVSYVLGINKECNTLTKLGKITCYLLNWLDPLHVEKAVSNEKNKQ